MPNKIALVTGGSRGLGKDMAYKIAAKGIDVVITYNNNEEMALQTVNEIRSSGGKAFALKLNMSDFHSLDAFIRNFTELLKTNLHTNNFDFLVNNAGMGKTVPFTEVTEALFDDFMNVHFKGIYFLTQKLLTYINTGGGIINISTGTTRFSNPGYSVYASMKGAIEVFTKYLAKELGSKGIRANVVAPGPIETDFNSGTIRNNPQLKNTLTTLTPLGRVGTASDIGGVVAFLCSEDSQWINGQRIEVSGGINV
jgi:NAD(P)-dependent dehydrogenase (short-subunit alcohol dehydrogenase family)